MTRFGCKRCWPPSAAAAWEARASLAMVAEIIDESHYRVTILACPHCRQRFVSVFTETIDWLDGDDPQSWVQMPVTEEETSELTRQGAALSETALTALAPGRRCLELHHPKGAPRRIEWSEMHIRPHDG